MKRIIRSNAVATSNEVSNLETTRYLHLAPMSEVVNLAQGKLTSFVPTKEVEISVMEDNANSVSLQTILNRQPSVVPYLVILSGIAFLAMSLIWAVNTRVEEVSLHIELAPSSGREKALKTVNYHTDIKIIPKQFKSTEVRIKYQAKQPRKVKFVHTYRVADMFFEE